MAEIQYSISELHNLFELKLRNSMFLNEKADMHEVALDNKNTILSDGNPVLNRLYKSMKMPTLLNHINIATDDTVTSKNWPAEEHSQDYDYIIDDGRIEASSNYNNRPWKKPAQPVVLSQYKQNSKLNLYQPYFKPTGRISDFAVANSISVVGLRFPSKGREQTSILYSDAYGDNDINCVTVVIDVGKSSTVDIKEVFENKDGTKIYKIVYLVRDYAELTLERQHSTTGKDTGINIIETQVIQFPGSKFKYNVSGEGTKYTQDLMYVDVYDKCTTDIKGSFDLYGENINNTVVNIHHKGVGSTSRINIKSIVDDLAHSSFAGCITVDKIAVDTDAELYNRNLLLSSRATAITEPQLDINTKEITCKHGCTVSNIDKNELYYLTSKGIETTIAEETLKQCFLMM